MFTQALMTQFGFCDFVIKQNTEGMTDAEALAAPPGGGSNVNWVLGHILAARNLMFGAMGQAPFWDDATAAPYQRGKPSTQANAPGTLSLERLLADYDACSQRLMASVEALSDEQLAVQTSGLPTGDAPLSDSLAGLLFHEAYHAGQIGTLRRLAGKDGALA